MNKPFASIIMVLMLFSCSINSDKESETNPFQTDESSKLFFKNVRRSFYEFENLVEAKLEVYRYKKRVESADEPIINLAIVNNWRYDEAYVLIEANTFLLANSDTLSLRFIEAGSLESLSYSRGNKETQLRFAQKIYEQIGIENEIEILVTNSWIPLFENGTAKEAFRITMKDYNRLIRND